MENKQYCRLLSSLKESQGKIIGREDYHNSMVLAPFTQVDGDLCLLFEKRAPGIRQGNEICFPGGASENRDLSYEETAIRETVEELGIERERIRVDGHLGTLVATMGTVVEVFLGWIDARDREDFNPNPFEVSRLLFVPFSWFLVNPPELYSLDLEIRTRRKNSDGPDIVVFPARELGLPERYWDSWPGRANNLFVYRYGGEVIWGMTARMVREIVKLWEKSNDVP